VTEWMLVIDGADDAPLGHTSAQSSLSARLRFQPDVVEAPGVHSAMKSRRMASSLKMSPALLTMSAFKVSCGTRRAPRTRWLRCLSATGLAVSAGWAPPVGLHGPLLLGRLRRRLLRRASDPPADSKRILLCCGAWRSVCSGFAGEPRWLRSCGCAPSDGPRMRRDRPMLPSGERARNASCKHTFHSA